MTAPAVPAETPAPAAPTGLLLLLVLLVPMIYYVISTNRSSQVAS